MATTRAPKCINAPFRDLKTILDKHRFVIREREEPARKSDEEIFREAMSDVKEIPEFRHLPEVKTPKMHRVLPPKDESLEMLQRLIRGEIKVRLSDTSEFMAWVRPNLRKDIVDKLHGGEYSVQDSIDLHGMTLAEAEQELFHFFRNSIRRRLFCVKVIHGRGLRSPHGPVLKEALKRLLHRSFSKWVLAYATARHSDGGLGATYIILKS